MKADCPPRPARAPEAAHTRWPAPRLLVGASTWVQAPRCHWRASPGVRQGPEPRTLLRVCNSRVRVHMHACVQTRPVCPADSRLARQAALSWSLSAAAAPCPHWEGGLTPARSPSSQLVPCQGSSRSSLLSSRAIIISEPEIGRQ